MHWFSLAGTDYVEIPPDGNGIIKSGIFPGLWLSPAELLAGTLAGLFALVDEGVQTPEHAAFCERLASAK